MDNSNGEAGLEHTPSWSRRRFLLASASLALFTACRRSDTAAATQPDTEHDAPQYSAAEKEFLILSTALTGKNDLDPIISRRILAALNQLAPATAATLGKLKQIAHSVDTPAQMIAVPGVRDAALAIIAAWYTGTVGTGTAAVTVAYRDALMQRPVADGLYPPTYAMGGPAWWVAEPPPATPAH